MNTYIALLRAVNVGGTGKLAMADLKEICNLAGLNVIGTYIQSGNVIAQSSETADRVQINLERRLLQETGKAIKTFIRSAAQMRALLRANPFPKADPKLTYVFFFDEKPPRDALANMRRRTDEEVRAGEREIYVYYPAGMGQSKLAIPAAAAATARNFNTVTKLDEMCSKAAGSTQ